MQSHLLQKIEDYILEVKVPQLSFSFMRKNALAEFHEASAKLEAAKKRGTFKLNAAIISQNKVLEGVLEGTSISLGS